MKNIIILAIALAFTTTGSFAQSASANVSFSTTQQGPNPAADQQAKDATDKLNNIVQLSPDQYNQVLQLNKNYYYHPASPVGRGAGRQGYNRESQLKSILTSEQWSQYQNAKQQGQIQ